MVNVSIKSLHAAKLPFKSLVKIVASYSPMENIDFQGVQTNLVELLLTGTKLVSFSTKGWITPVLRKIVLNNSPVQYIDLSEGAESLEFLELKGTKFTSFDEKILNTPMIDYINLNNRVSANLSKIETLVYAKLQFQKRVKANLTFGNSIHFISKG